MSRGWKAGYLLLALFLAGCASKDVEEAIRAAVKDPAKADSVLREFEEEKALLAALKGEQQANALALYKLNADYNTPDSRFEVFYSSLTARTKVVQGEFMRRHLAMRELLNEEEWNKINKVMRKVAVKKFKEAMK